MTNQWRVGHTGRDMMYYEELHEGAWRRIPLDGEMLTGRAHHVIFFANEETWQRYPEWARHRRDEIIARIKSQFREPDYEYAEGGTAGSAPAREPGPEASKPAPAPPPKKDGGIFPAILFLLAVAAACFWFTWRGLETGETRLPMKQGHHRRAVTRATDPALFWTSIGIKGGLGGGCLLLSGWLISSRFRKD